MSDEKMDLSDGWIVYERTDKGNQEIQDRKNKLSQNHRAILIVVDGQKNKWSILNQFPKLEASQSLAELEQQGFIAKTQSSLEDQQRRLMLAIPRHNDSKPAGYMNNTFKLVLLVLASLIVIPIVLLSAGFRGTADLLVVVFVVYALPLSTTVLLFVAKKIKSKPLMTASLLCGIIPSAIVLLLIIGSAKGGSRNYSPLIILVVCLPWLVMRTPAYLLCKVKDDAFKKQNDFLNLMFAIDCFLLVISGVVVISSR